MANRAKYLAEEAAIVRKILDEHYEPGRQDRSKIQAYRKHVQKILPMSERKFWQLLKISRLNEQ
jgi:hypothetical protein